MSTKKDTENTQDGGEDEYLKVKDVCSFSRDDSKRILKSTMRLDALCKLYYKTDQNPFILDELKRKFLAELSLFIVEFAKVRAFKSGNHVYLEEQRKKLKSDAIEHLVKQGKKRTEAEVIVYSSDYYRERFNLLEDLKKVFIKYEFKYEYYDKVFNSIVQSISTGGKEYTNYKHV